MRRFSCYAGALAVLMALSNPAGAGQVRVTVGSTTMGNVFIPAGVTINQGDHVVWVWGAGNHSVTQGDTMVCDNPGTGSFDTNTLPNNSTRTAFTRKFPSTSTGIPYYCIPHCPGMDGLIVVNASGAAVADFRITEVQYNLAGGLDLIEITNMGDAAGDLGRYRFAAGGDTTVVPASSWVVPSLGRVTVHVNASAAQVVPTQLYLPHLLPGGVGLPDNGSLALYLPNTVNSVLNDATQIIDFVQWGAGGQANEATAVAASPPLWSTGNRVEGVAPNHAIEFCGDRGLYGVTHWAEISGPNFGSDGNCSTPSRPTSWGRLKIIYR